MARNKEISQLSYEEACKRHQEKLSELVKFRVSMDPSVFSGKGGIVGLRREIRALGQRIAQGANVKGE